MRNPWISLAGFVVAVAVLAWAYVTLIHNGLVYFDGEFWKATALMLVGTFLFFWSVAGFVIAVVERTRGVYFRGLAMFTTRQIASKVNTAFLSLSVVCVMLFFSLTVFSTGAGLVQLFTGNVEEGTQYDATLAANLYLALDNVSEDKLAEMQAEDAQAAADYVAAQEARAAEVRAEAEKWDWSIERRLAEAVPDWDGFVKDAVQVDMYQPKRDTTTYGELMDRFGVALGSKEQNEGLRPQNVGMVGVSQFNAARALAGREPIEVGEGQFAVNNAFEMTEELSRSMAQRGTEIVVDGQTLVATGEYVEQMLSTTTFSNDAATIIVPDAVIDGLRAAGEAPYASYLDVDYKVDRAEGDQLLYAALAQTLPPDQQQAGYGWQYRSAPWPVTVVTTANEVIEQSGGMRMMITYLALYIGFVFLITTAALLAIRPALRDERLAAALPAFGRDRLRPPHDLPLAGDAGGRVLPGAAGAGGVPFRVCRGRAGRKHVRTAGHLGDRSRPHDGGVHGGGVRQLPAGHVLREPRHRARLAGQAAPGVGAWGLQADVRLQALLQLLPLCSSAAPRHGLQ